MKSLVIPLSVSTITCFLAGLVGGIAEDWIRNTPPGDTLDLALGLGVLGLFPGLAWAWLERTVSRRGGDVAGTRRRLLLMTLIGSAAVGLGLGALLAVLPSIFSKVMTGAGFSLPATGLARWAASGFLLGGALGASVGFSTGWLVGMLKRP